MAKRPAAKKKVAKKKTAKKTAKKTTKKKAAKKKSPRGRDRGFPDLLETQPDEVQRVARRLRGLVIETLSDVVESVVGGEKAGLAIYKRNGSAEVVCGIQPVGDACLLHVQNVEPRDGDRLELQGTGKNARHVRFETLVDVTHDDVRGLLQRLGTRVG